MRTIFALCFVLLLPALIPAQPGKPFNSRYYRMYSTLSTHYDDTTQQDVNFISQTLNFSGNSPYADSLSYFYWNADLVTDNWQFLKTQVYTYNQEMSVTRIEDFYPGYDLSPAYVVYEYNPAGNLLSATQWTYYNEMIGYYVPESYSFTYNNDYLWFVTKKEHTLFAPYSEFSRWELVWNNDDRISTALYTTSSDSINWLIEHQENFTYATGDETDHNDVHDNIARYFTNGLYRHHQFDVGLPFLLGYIGKISVNDALYDYNGSTWDSQARIIYTYDDQGRLDYVEACDVVGTNVFPFRKLDYTYEDFGPLQKTDYMETTGGIWGNPLLTEYYYYQNITSSNDPVLPSPRLELTASPNPFAQSTEIRFDSKRADPVCARVYNLKGELVKNLGESKASLTWDGTDNSARQTSPGIYILKAESGTQHTAIKLIRIR